MMQNAQWVTNFEFTSPQPPGVQQNGMEWQQQYNMQQQQQNGNNFSPYVNNNVSTGQNEFGISLPFTCNPQPFSQNNSDQSNTSLSGSGLTFTQMTQFQSGQPNNFSGGQYSGGPQTISTGSQSIPLVPQPFSNDPQPFSNGTQSSAGGTQPFAGGLQTFADVPQNFINGSQPFPQVPQNLTSGPQQFPKKPQNFTNGSQTFPQVSQNFTSGPQQFPENPQNFTNGSQPFPQVSQNFTSGTQQFPENPQNFTNGTQSFPLGQHNFTSGPQSVAEHSQNYANDKQYLSQVQQNFTNSTPPYSQSPQSFVNSPQSFPQAPQNFINGPQAFPEGSQNFTCGVQAFPQDSKNFTGGSQPFPQSPQNFTLGPQCYPSQNVPWGPQPFLKGPHYFPNGPGQPNFTNGHQTFQNNPQFLSRGSHFSPGGSRFSRQKTHFQSGPKSRNPIHGPLPRQPTDRKEYPDTGRKWKLGDVVSSPVEQNCKANAHCPLSEREKEYLANDSLKLPPVLKFKGLNSSKELLAKVDQVVSKLMSEIKNSDIYYQSNVNTAKVSFRSRIHKLMYDKENTSVEKMYEMYRTNYSLEDDRKLIRGEKKNSDSILPKKIIWCQDGRSKPVPKYSVQLLKAKVHAALEIRLSEIIYKMSEICKQENGHNNTVESDNTTKGQSSSTITEDIKPNVENKDSVQAENTKSKATTVGIRTRIEAKKVSNQRSEPKRTRMSNPKRLVEYDESSDEDINVVSDRQSVLIKTGGQKLNDSKNECKETDIKKEDLDNIDDDSTHDHDHLDNRIKAIMKQCLVMMLQRYKHYLATLIIKDEGFVELLQHRVLSLANLTKQKTVHKYFVQIAGRPRMPAPVIMKRFLDRFAQVSIARLKLQRQGLILAIATEEKYAALLRLNNYALGGQVLKIQSVASDQSLQWKCC